MRIATAVFLFLLASTSDAQDNQCGALIKDGVFDESSNTAEISQHYSSYDWICSEEIRTSQDVDNKSAELGVPIDDVPVKLGWKDNEQSFSDWKHRFCQTHSVSSGSLAMQREFTRQASQTLVGGFIECISSPGLHVWRSPASEGEAAFSAKFVPLDPEHSSANLLVESSPGVTCTHDELMLTQATQHIRCTRSVIRPQVVYFSSSVFNVVPGSFTLPGPPSIVAHPQPCEDVPSGPIEIAFDKNGPAQKRLGPYCVPVSVLLRASGQAKRNSAGTASSKVTIYSTATPSSESVLCSSGVTLSGNEVGTISVHCPSYGISAHHIRAFSINANDSSADTYNLSWTLDIKPLDENHAL